MKKLISLFMSMVMLLSITAGLNLTANASYYNNAKQSGNLTYVDLDDGTVKITGFWSDYGKISAVVPSTIDGKIVSSMAENVFYAWDKKIVIPDTITNISEQAFDNANRLEEIVVDEKNPNYSSVDGVLYNKDKTTLIHCPSMIKTERFTIPDNVTTITKYAFRSVRSVKTLDIPASITQLNAEFFEHSSLEKINISPNNPNYTSVDGVIFTKDMKTIVKFPNGSKITSYTVPKGVETIGDRSFAYCSKLQKIKMQTGVKAIGNSAFYFASGLKKIEVPATVKSVGKLAFGTDEYYEDLYHNGIKAPKLYYEGTALQWGKLYCDKSSKWYRGGFYYLYAKTPSKLDYFDFDVDLKKKTVTIYGYYGKAKSLVIPDSVSGYKINGFVTSGGEKNTTVKKIKFGSNIKYISWSTFNDFDSLEQIEVSNKNKNFSTKDGVLFNKKKTEIIYYPSAKANKSYKIPDSVTKIKECSFGKCKKSINIILPAKLKTIENYSFNKKVKSYSISSKNKNFSTKDGVLFNKNKSTLILYPSSKTSKTYVIPKSVKTIGDFAFIECSYLTTLKMPKSVKYVENPITNFDHCKKLKNVYYSGSKSEWNKIKFHYNKKAKTYNGSMYGSLKFNMNNAKIHYNAKF